MIRRRRAVNFISRGVALILLLLGMQLACAHCGEADGCCQDEPACDACVVCAQMVAAEEPVAVVLERAPCAVAMRAPAVFVGIFPEPPFQPPRV